ncbi:MAG TPA: aminotransferase class I/II-fold pyridoxal phosphate-dependent enzyme [Gaiellaceae bacterium]|nr:aminotransferase class I/II-fold pyridoxal phosphate-dependent enzyme [Gaiellaceae bacterium]
MRPLAPEFVAYSWSTPTDEVAALAGIDPSQVIRFDQNTSPLPLPSSRPGTIAGALATINHYPPGGYRELHRAIADRNGVDPENVVLGLGADDLILLCARAFAGPGDSIAIEPERTYPLYRIAAQLAGAQATGAHLPSTTLTFTCRPNSPTGELAPLPEARPLVVDEAYHEYCGETALPLVADGDVIVLRTFSKAYALAGARVGYALASRELAAELNARQAPAPVTSLSAALAVAALASPPDVAPVVEERERLASSLRALGLEPLPSNANFLFVPAGDGRELAERLLRQGLVVRAYDDGIRITVRDAADDDVLTEALARILDRPSPVAERAGRSVRHLRATAETRIAVRLGLDGASRVSVQTGAGIYDHFLEQLAFHAGLDLIVEGAGDLETGDHHTVEDTALAFGEALDRALGDRRGIARYGDAVVPMDDALARAAVDLGGRPFAELSFEAEPGLARHFFGSLAQAGRLAVHVEATGRDPHHTAEAAYKAVGRALRVAVRAESAGIPSTKGVL